MPAQQKLTKMKILAKVFAKIQNYDLPRKLFVPFHIHLELFVVLYRNISSLASCINFTCSCGCRIFLIVENLAIFRNV